MSVLSALAVLGSGVLSSAGQLYANKKNLEYQDEANRLQVELANTAHQREVQDLQAAGLNPILSAQGSGAAVPQLGAASVANPGEGVAGAMSSAAKLQALEIPKVESQVAVNSATAKNLEVQNELLRSQVANTDANTLQTLHNTKYPGVLGQNGRAILNGVVDLSHGVMDRFGIPHGLNVSDAIRKPDPPSSARKVHDLGNIEVSAPEHRWYHHIPGFRD